MNDVPLIQKADINSINTSIIAIKKQLKQLNEAVGLIDIPDVPSNVLTRNDLADSVTSGNMNPVTSNAVAEKCTRFPDYSENLFTSSTDINTWTAPKDCWFEWSFVSGSGTRSIAINENRVSIALTINNQYYSHFEGFLKSGDIVSSGNNVLNTNTTKAYALT